MGTFTKVASDAFEALQLDAGVLLSSYDLAAPYTAPADWNYIKGTVENVKRLKK